MYILDNYSGLVHMVVTDELIALAKKDLARRKGISVKKIDLKCIEVVDWPDASLGCPEEGKYYAQVVNPGYRLVLSDGNGDFEYHTDKRLKVIYCSFDKK